MKFIKQMLYVAMFATGTSLLAWNTPVWAKDNHAAAEVAKADAPKTKEVCKDVVGKDNKPVKNKDGSVKQACKTIKIHKKHEGTEIPPKK